MILESRLTDVHELKKSVVLNSLDEIRKIDKSNMLSFCMEASKHYGKAAQLAAQFNVDLPRPENIIVAGMGGSGIGGELFKDWAQDRTSIPY